MADGSDAADNVSDAASQGFYSEGTKSPTKPAMVRSVSSFSVGSKNSRTSQVSDSGSSGFGRETEFATKADNWGYLFRIGADKFQPVESGGLQTNERKIAIQLDGISVIPRTVNQVRNSKPNNLCTTRFTFLNWLPKSLANQFRRVANIYFLFICVIVCFPWSPKAWHSKLVPFVGVLLWTACKDMYEDMRRRRDDRAENSQAVRRLVKAKDGRATKFEDATWADVLVGDVLIITKDTAFPADVLLMHAAGGHESFISTVMLDGETSLKERSAPGIFEAMSRECGKQSNKWLAVQNADLNTAAQEPDPCPRSKQEEIQTSDASDLDDDKAFGTCEDMESEICNYINVMARLGLDIKLAAPTATLHDVRGAIHTRSEAGDGVTAVCPFGQHHFMPRGCVLRNTPWVVGVAVYVGDDSKARLNALQGRVSKFPNMQMHLNNCIRGLLVLLFIVCSVSVFASYVGEGTLAESTDDNVVIKFFRFTIIFYHIVPLSLYVVYEMLKLFLGYRLNSDNHMIDPATGERALARTADLMEEMGQINFVFSDKTGTLTCNDMVFAQCDIAGTSFGDFRGADAAGFAQVKNILRSELEPSEPADMPLTPRSVVSQPSYAGAKCGASGRSEKDPMLNSAVDFFTCLAVCHSVVKSRRTTEDNLECRVSGTPRRPHKAVAACSASGTEAIYSGASPDEVALVDAARQAGVAFQGRRRKLGGISSELILRGPGDRQRRFALLFELPFSSDRKRMSVLIRRRGEVWCVTKGADSVMEGLLREPLPASTHRHITEYAAKGLRTLVVAMKKVSAEEWETWSAEYAKAREAIDNSKDARLADVAAKMETKLRYVGVTAVEDRLQAQVPETISIVKAMGIRLWVLTGDKTETAVDIAKSCNLFSSSTTLAYAVGARDEKDAEDVLLRAYSELEGKTEAGIVLDGQTLLHAFKSPECRKVIYDLGVVSQSCICSRMSPQQKLQLVQLVREQNAKAITLSIGDGANDVPMIYGAHVGVAVRGKEGTQAVQASDIAISQFRFLVPLLQCHGRRAYRRVALFLCFFLYKNVALIMLDIVWMVQFRFKGMVAVPEWLSINYNAFFTSLHILPLLGLDLDLPDAMANMHPDLYKVGPARALFNLQVFGRWLLSGIYHGAVCWLVPLLLIQPDIHNVVKDSPSDFWVSSVSAFTAVIFVVCLKLVVASQNPFSLFTWLPTMLAFLGYFVYLLGISYTKLGNQLQPNMQDLPRMMHQEAWSSRSVMIATIVAILPDTIARLSRYFICPSDLDAVCRGKRRPQQQGPLAD